MVERVVYEVDGWGIGELGFRDGELLWHELPQPTLEVSADVGVGVHLHHSLVDRFREYFGGARTPFSDVALDLAWCTPFQRRVIETLRSIPYGETATYGEVAALAGHPNAQRAVGSVCAANRFALVVPCHRVVSAGGLGSYGSLGLGYKRRLLELEGVAL
jgi:methylated-DNA-[protein]-cysteine S-methyltransferase